MPSTLVHGLVPTTCALLTHQPYRKMNGRRLFLFACLAATLANCPDLDMIPAFFSPDTWTEIHRNWGHNIFSLTLWVTLGGLAFRKGFSKEMGRLAAWSTSATLVASHVFFDSMQVPNHLGLRTGVPLLWPISKWQFTLPLPIFASSHLDKTLNPVVAHFVAVDFWTGIVYRELFASFVFIFLYAVLLRAFRERMPSRFGTRQETSTNLKMS